jgi:cell division protein FtsW
MPIKSPTFNTPFRIFLLTLLLAVTGIVMVYSSSANYISRNERLSKLKSLNNRQKDLEELRRNLKASPSERSEEQRGALLEVEQKLKELQKEREIFNSSHNYHNPRLAIRQFVWVCIGFSLMMGAYLFDYTRLKLWSPWILAFSVLLLICAFVPGVNDPVSGPHGSHFRWIKFGPLRFQPSELAKLALVIYMARMLNDRNDQIKDFFHGVLPALGITAICAALVVSEPDIGATAVMVTIIFLMWYIGGMRVLHLLGLVSATIPAFVMVILKYPDRVDRILAFLTPTAESNVKKGHQLLQSLIAVGSGGLEGLGFGNSMQKHYLTEQFSDFIFAIICEETGFIGASLIVLCFFLLIWEGWRVALRAPDFYSSLLASGITLMLAINVVLNLMVVLGLAPTKGLVLPFLSAGGSNIIVMMISMGILMNIGSYIEQEQETVAAEARRRKSKGGSGAASRPLRPRYTWFGARKPSRFSRRTNA